jgi:hypothetical protein
MTARGKWAVAIAQFTDQGWVITLPDSFAECFFVGSTTEAEAVVKKNRDRFKKIIRAFDALVHKR